MDGSTNTFHLKSGIVTDGYIGKLSIGASGGIGYYINSRYHIDLRYYARLLNFSDSVTSGHAKNNLIQFSVGYRLSRHNNE